MSSVAQIVKRVIEDLSEGVSELVLTVVVLSEQNVPIPPGVVDTAKGVNETALSLSQIARQLARTNYKPYPEISNEIEGACTAVDEAVAGMRSSLERLQTGNLKSGWNGLLDACRVMSGKTIRLLQIVYGADLKRLLIVAENLKNELKNMNTDDLVNDPESFAKKVTQAGTKMTSVGNYLKQRAVEAESDLAKEKLIGDSQKMYQDAKAFIQTANAALSNPDDPGKRAQLDSMLEKLSGQVEDAVDYAEEVSPEAKSIVKGVDLSAGASSLQDLPNPKPLKHKPKFQDELSHSKAISPLDDQLDRTRDAVDDLELAALADPTAFVQKARIAKQEIEQLKADALKMNEDDLDVNALLNKLDKSFGEQIRAAKNVVQEPTNHDNKKILEMKTKDTKDLLEDLDELSKAPQSLNNNIENLSQVMHDVIGLADENYFPPPPVDFDESVPKHKIERARSSKSSPSGIKKNPSILKTDPKKGKKELAELMDKASNLASKVKQQGRMQAKDCLSLDEQQEIIAVLDSLDDQINQLNEFTELLPEDKIPLDKLQELRVGAEQFNDTLKVVKDKTHADSLDCIDDIKKYASDVAHDALRGDDGDLENDLKKLKDITKKFEKQIDSIKDSIDSKDPRRDELEELKDRMIEDEELLASAAKQLITDFENDSLRSQVESLLDNFNDNLEDMKDVIANRDPQPPESHSPLITPVDVAKKHVYDIEEAALNKNPKDLVAHTQNQKKALEDLRTEAKKMIKDSQSDKAKDIEDALGVLDKAFPNQIMAAQKVMKASPAESEMHQAALEAATKQMIHSLDDVLLSASAPSLADSLLDMMELGDSIKANTNNRKKAMEDLQDLEDLNKLVQDEGKYLMKVNSDPVEQELMKEALEHLDDAVRFLREDLVSGKSPQDIALDINDLKKALDEVEEETHSSALNDLDNLRKNIALQNHAAERNDETSYQERADKTKMAAGNLEKELQAVAMVLEDVSQKAKLLHHAEVVDSLLDKYYTTADALQQDPNSEQTKRALDDLSSKIGNALDNIEDALHHKAPSASDPMYALPKISTPLHKEIEKTKASLIDLCEAVETKNVPALHPILQKVRKNIDVLHKDAKKILEDPYEKNMDKKRDIQDALNSVTGANGFVPLVHAFKGFLDNPDDDNMKSIVEDKASNLLHALNDLDLASDNYVLNDNINNLNNILDKINDLEADDGTPIRDFGKNPTGKGGIASAKKNPKVPQSAPRKGKKELDDLIDKASALADAIKSQAGAMGTTNKDKRRPKAIHNDLEDIDDVIKTMKNTIDDLDWNNPEAYNDIAGGCGSATEQVEGSC